MTDGYVAPSSPESASAAAAMKTPIGAPRQYFLTVIDDCVDCGDSRVELTEERKRHYDEIVYLTPGQVQECRDRQAQADALIAENYALYRSVAPDWPWVI